VAKTYHRVGGVDYQAPDGHVGAWTPIVVDGQALGAVVRTRRGVKPVFVSSGNWIDLDTAVAVALSLVEPTSRLPVPVRQADLATHQARRQAQLGRRR
jgi:deoxyribonuclease V